MQRHPTPALLVHDVLLSAVMLLLPLLLLLLQRGMDIIMFGGEFSDHVKDKV
jgi:hypothetical protein